MGEALKELTGDLNLEDSPVGRKRERDQSIGDSDNLIRRRFVNYVNN